jgi:two-component system response regulator RpfG
MPTVVLLDRESSRRQHLLEVIGQVDPGITLEAFVNPVAAMGWLRWHRVDLLVADSLFPGMDAADLVRRIRAAPGGASLPLLMMVPWDDRETRCKVLEAGATDLLATPVDDLELRPRCKNLLTQRAQQHIIHERARWLEQRVSEATSEIRRREHETLLRLAKAGEFRDEDTGDHVIRMARYARLIAQQLGLSEHDCDIIELAAPMHDIGKIGIPDEILRKPGRLSHSEFETMKRHTQIGYEILKDSPSEYLQTGAVIALSHHERFNGTGYPHRLGGADIPLAARIVTVADTYDALTSARPYKAAWPLEKALAYVNSQRGRLFDPECLDAFQAQLARVVKVQYMGSEEPRKVSNGG